MTAWDVRAGLRALGATLLALAVVWLITAASDEGQLTMGARAGRTLPLAPLCSAVGAALALGTTRVRSEVRALEALGRSPGESARTAALGAALPSLVIALAVMFSSSVDVGGFYPRAPNVASFVREEGAFTSASLGVTVTDDGEARPLDDAEAASGDEGLPRGARIAAASTTAIAAIALSLVASRAVLRPSLSDRRTRRRSRVRAATMVLSCAMTMLLAFQAAAAHVAPAWLAIVPPLLLLAAEVAYRRARYRAFA